MRPEPDSLWALLRGMTPDQRAGTLMRIVVLLQEADYKGYDRHKARTVHWRQHLQWWRERIVREGFVSEGKTVVRVGRKGH